MKVGILTFPNSQSYGATLQMYALQQAVERLGHTAEVINYHNHYMRMCKHVRRDGESMLHLVLRTSVSRCLHARLYRVFRDFEKEYIRLSPDARVAHRDTLRRLGERYDAVICGSDQVWNPKITGNDMSYFLDFCTQKTKRVAYAPSFGFTQFPESFCQAIQPELERFEALSVREEAGKDIIKTLVEKPVTVVADPTFLIDKNEWEKLEQSYPTPEGGYVLLFTVRKAPHVYERGVQLAREKGLKAIVVGGNSLRNKKNDDPRVEYAVDIGPREWLYLMHHARYVVTNSFHGTAFSVIFQKDFYVEYPKHTSSRLSQIIERFGLQSRVLQQGEPLTDEPMPYEQAQETLAVMREQSLHYLQAALDD